MNCMIHASSHIHEWSSCAPVRSHVREVATSALDKVQSPNSNHGHKWTQVVCTLHNVLYYNSNSNPLSPSLHPLKLYPGVGVGSGKNGYHEGVCNPPPLFTNCGVGEGFKGILRRHPPVFLNIAHGDTLFDL